MRVIDLGRGPSTPVRRWCATHDCTYAALAKRTGIARSTICRIAAGEVQPIAKHAHALHRETKIPLAELIGSALVPISARPGGAVERARLANPRGPGAVERALMERKAKET